MAKTRYRCVQCKRYSDVCGHISKRGLCADCGDRNMIENALAVRGTDELGHQRWLERWRAACGDKGRPETAYGPAVAVARPFPGEGPRVLS